MKQFDKRFLRFLGAAALAVGAVALAGSTALEGEALNGEFEALIGRYLAEVRGVGANVESHDMSAAAFERQVETQRRILADLRRIDRGTLSFEQDIDYRFLQSILRGNIIWGENVERWRQDPRGYLGIGRGWSVRPNRLNYLLTVDPRTPDERGAEILAGLELLQTRLANGKRNLNQPIHRWIELDNCPKC